MKKIDPKLKQGVQAAYKLGLQRGRDERNRLLRALQTTNHHLWEQLLKAIEEEPLEGDGIVISYKFAEELITALPHVRGRHGSHSYRLRRMINKSRHDINSILNELQSK